MITLGIETSCDETSICILNEVEILSLKTHSQVNLHSAYGGVVPEIASRDHLTKIQQLATQCVMESGIGWGQIDFISCTTSPGLIGSLLTGITFGMGVATALGIPFVPVNHLDGHIFTCNLTHKISEDFLCLLVSGGHTAIYDVDNINNKTLIGQSIDDSIGEVFDKISKAMGFGYPGGARVEAIARFGNPERFKFGIPLKGKSLYDFSMSGLKTEFLKLLQNVPRGTFFDDTLGYLPYETPKSEFCGEVGGDSPSVLSNISTNSTCNVQHGTFFDGILKNLSCNSPQELPMYLADVCASFQKTVCRVIIDRLANTLKTYKRDRLVFCGGVAANNYIRGELENFCNFHGMEFCVPSSALCGDNAGMIANAGMLSVKSRNYIRDGFTKI